MVDARCAPPDGPSRRERRRALWSCDDLHCRSVQAALWSMTRGRFAQGLAWEGRTPCKTRTSSRLALHRILERDGTCYSTRVSSVVMGVSHSDPPLFSRTSREKPAGVRLVWPGRRWREEGAALPATAKLATTEIVRQKVTDAPHRLIHSDTLNVVAALHAEGI